MRPIGMQFFVIALATLLGACGGGEAGTGDDETKAGKDERAPEEGGGGAKDEGASAEGDAVIAAETVSDCPKSLGGGEKGKHRIVKKECGTVTVTEDYYVDAGSLTLEAGATLAFQEGKGLSIGYYEPAKLIVKGTKEAPVTLTAAGDMAAGVWSGVHVYPKAKRSTIDWLVLEYAGEESGGALHVEAADVAIENSTFRESKGPGLTALGEIDFARMSGNTFEKNGKDVAIEVDARPSGSLGTGNVLAAMARVVVRAGKVKDGGRWTPQGAAPFAVMGDVYVEGEGSVVTFTIEPGAEVRFDKGKNLHVGYHGPGALKAAGTADKPIVLTSTERKGPGEWGGVRIANHGEAAFEHVRFEHGGEGEEGVLSLARSERGATTVKACRFEKDTAGIFATEEEAKLGPVSGTTFAATAVAMSIFPGHLASIAADNVVEKGARLVVKAGVVSAGDARWHPPVAVEIAGDVYVEKSGVLTVEAGTELAVAGGKGILVGYHDAGTLKILGTAEKPVTIRALEKDEPGLWKGVELHDHARGSVLEHVRLRNAGEEKAAGVEARGGAEAALTDVTCEKCGAGPVGWECMAKLTVDGKPPAVKCR